MSKGKLEAIKGTIFKRGKIYYAGWYYNGKRFQVSTKKTIKEEAEAVLLDLTAPFLLDDKASIYEVVKNRLDEARRERIKIDDVLDKFLDDAEKDELAITTISHHRGRFNKLRDWATKTKNQIKYADELSLADARAFMGEISQGNTAKTFNDYRALFMQIWDMLIRHNLVEVNPWREIRRKKRIAHSKREMNASQIAQLLNAAQGEMRLLFIIGIYTGLRLKDAALLNWKSIDLSRRFITLNPAKTARKGIEVKIPIVQPLYDALTAEGVIPSSGFVLPEIAATYNRSDSLLSNRVQAIFKSAGIETAASDDGITRKACEYGFHSFRHTFVSMAFEYRIPLPIVQAIVGHTNTAMTRHYLHIAPDELSKAMEAFKALPLPNEKEEECKESATMKAFKAAAIALSANEREAARMFLNGLM